MLSLAHFGPSVGGFRKGLQLDGVTGRDSPKGPKQGLLKDSKDPSGQSKHSIASGALHGR